MLIHAANCTSSSEVGEVRFVVLEPNNNVRFLWEMSIRNHLLIKNTVSRYVYNESRMFIAMFDINF